MGTNKAEAGLFDHKRKEAATAEVVQPDLGLGRRLAQGSDSRSALVPKAINPIGG